MLSLICTVWMFIASFGSLVADSFFSTYSVDVIDGQYGESHQEIVLYTSQPTILKRQLGQGTYPIAHGWFWELDTSCAHPIQDEEGRLVRLESAEGVLATFDYAPTAITVTAYEGTKWIYHLEQGSLQKVSYPGGSSLSYLYDPASHKIVQKTTEAGALLTNYYYHMGVNRVGDRIVTITDPSDPALGRIREQGNPSSLVYYFYTEGSTEVVDANGQRTVFFYDPIAKHIISIIYYLNGPDPYRIERFTWNSDLVEKTIEDEQGNIFFTEHYDYDEDHRLIRQTLYGDLTGTGGNSESYSHEWIYEKGLLVKEKEDNGTWISYIYDDSSQLKERIRGKDGTILKQEPIFHKPAPPSCSPSSFVNLTLPLKSEERTYDRLGRLIREKGSSYSYDVMDRMTSSTAPSGERTEITYNVRGSPTHVRYGDGTEERLFYHLDGTLKEIISREGASVYYQEEGQAACFSSQLDDHLHEHSFSGVFGQGERYSHCRITFINGINVTEEELFQGLHMMSSSHGGCNIHYSYMASLGWTKDMLKSLYTKTGMILKEAESLAKIWRSLLQEDTDIFHYAHSLGGTTTVRAKELISPSDRSRIHVVTFGSATIIPQEDFKSVLNIISMRDGVPPLTDPFTYSQALLKPPSHILFIGSIFDGPPLIDHLFDAYWRSWTSQHWKYFESKLRR